MTIVVGDLAVIAKMYSFQQPVVFKRGILTFISCWCGSSDKVAWRTWIGYIDCKTDSSHLPHLEIHICDAHHVQSSIAQRKDDRSYS